MTRPRHTLAGVYGLGTLILVIWLLGWVAFFFLIAHLKANT